MPMLKKRLDDPKTAGVRRSAAREIGRRVCLSIRSGLFCFLDFRKNTFLFFGLILLIVAIQSAAFAVPTPTVSLNAPASASGIVTVTIDYSFPDNNGMLCVEISGQAVRPLDAFIFGGSSGSWPLILDTTFWPDGAYTIKAVASYANITGSSVSISRNITTTNTPQVSIASPSGEVRGIAEFNIPYRFPSAYAYGLFWFYFGSVEFQTVQIPLSSASTTEGNLQFSYDTTYWADGEHKIKVVAKIGQCHTCSDIRSPTAIQEVNLTANNAPTVKILSPSRRVKGIVNASLSYDFPATYYSQPALISLERQTIFGTYLTIASKSISLDSTQPTSGIWNFTFDVSNWMDGDYTLRAKATYRKQNYDYMLIAVANHTPVIPQTKEAPIKSITQVAEPINVATGNMFTSATDISIPYSQIPFELSRTYNSQDDFDGSFGYGWRSNFDIALSEQLDNSVIEVDEKGVYTIYTKNPDGTYQPSAGKYSILAKNPDGSFTLLRKHGRKLHFDNQGRLTKIEERNGNFLNILRDDSGLIQEVNDSSSRKLLFTQDSQGRIIRLEDPTGRIFEYEYDSSGNLVKLTDPIDNETTYQYDNNHNLVQQTDANRNSLYFEYDSQDRAVRSWQDGGNNEVSLSFDPVNKTTTVTDSLGIQTKYEYNDYGLVTKITDNQNNIQSFTWDDDLNKTSIQNQNGFTTTFTYDARGNLLSITDSLTNLTTFTYEPNFDLVRSVTDALGNITEYSYDAKGNLIQVKDALGNITSYSYDTQGLLTQVKDANNNLASFSYDTYGNLTQITDSLNNQTNFTYDTIGNKTQTADSQGNLTNFTYDSLNRLIQITYPDSSNTAYTYDPVGNLISFTDPNANTTTYTYDAVNRLIQVIDVQGNITNYSYDTEGNRTAITDAANNTTQYFYNSLSRLIKTQDALGNQTLFSYDAVGNLISRTDANGNTISYVYDALNRLTKKQFPDYTEVTYSYDAKGNLLTAANQSISYSYTYDSLGKLNKVIDSNNRLITYAYDALGNKTQMTTPENKTTTYAYDSLNRLVSILDTYNKTTTYDYDSLSRRTKTVLPNQTTASYIYDSLNNLINLVNKTQADEVLSSYAYEYDKTGNRLTKIEPDLKTSYTYDVLYRLTQSSPVKLKDNGEEKEKKNQLEIYSYDSLGNRLTSAKDAYSYNALNQLLTTPKYSHLYDLNGNLIKKNEIDDDETKTTIYGYDFENRLTQVIIQEEDETKTIAFSYDPFGRRIAKRVEEQEENETESETTTYIYDNEDIILEYRRKTEDNETKEETTRYTHGPGIDELISIEEDSQTYYYHYDGLGSVTSLTDDQGKTVETYTYDSFGNLKRQGNKTKNSFTYTGREYDKETGLYYYRNRYYDPKIGRFLTQDPLGMVDGPNLYSYVNNNPINFVDPWGLKKDKQWWQKLEEGYYYGTGFGSEAVEWYAQQQLETDNSLWAIPGSVASLWTPETYQATATALVATYAVATRAALIGMKVDLHLAHHTFKIFGKEIALRHIQITLWEIAKKGSHRIFRIPLP